MSVFVCLSKGPFELDDNDVVFFCRYVQGFILVTIQPISDNIKKFADNIKNLCHFRQVQRNPMDKFYHCSPYAELRYFPQQAYPMSILHP